jgi:hypothetical protein
MSRKYLPRITAAVFCVVLAACGGGGSSDDDPSPAQQGSNTGEKNGNDNTGSGTPNSSGDSTPLSGSSGGSTPPSTGSGSSGGNPGSPTTPTTGSFAATVTQAPENGATISGTVRILVEGSGIRNVELLPATGYAPLAARGTVTGDNVGAYIDFDTTVLPDGPITLRVAAFNAGPGGGGSEITAMAARTWTIQNSAAPAFSAHLVSAPPADAFFGFDPYGNSAPFEVSGTGLENVELVSANDASVIYGRFTISPDKTRASLNWNFYTEGMVNNRMYGEYNVRIVAWNVPPGQSGRSAEVMAPRRYIVHLPLGCQGEGTCGGMAP